jgi:putative endonuclease
MPSPSQRWGAARESLAEAALREEGFVILERNWRGGGGEIDRIAWDGTILCFVEVRARSTDEFGLPSETVDFRKKRKILRAASAYLARFSARDLPAARFDVVSIVDRGQGRREVAIIRDAFRPGLG